MKIGSRLAFAFATLICGASAREAFAAQPLTAVLTDMPGAQWAAVRETAVDQASNDGPRFRSAPQLVPFHETFEGDYTPASANVRLAMFSDDGCDVYIDGVRKLAQKDLGQALPDVANSLKRIDFALAMGQTYHIKVEYSNTVFLGRSDIDGATLFAYSWRADEDGGGGGTPDDGTGGGGGVIIPGDGTGGDGGTGGSGGAGGGSTGGGGTGGGGVGGGAGGVYAGAPIGLQISHDNGETWQDITKADGVPVTDLPQAFKGHSTGLRALKATGQEWPDLKPEWHVGNEIYEGEEIWVKLDVLGDVAVSAESGGTLSGTVHVTDEPDEDAN